MPFNNFRQRVKEWLFVEPDIQVKLYLSMRLGTRVSTIDHYLDKAVELFYNDPNIGTASQALAKSIPRESRLYSSLKNDRAAENYFLGLIHDGLSRRKDRFPFRTISFLNMWRSGNGTTFSCDDVSSMTMSWSTDINTAKSDGTTTSVAPPTSSTVPPTSNTSHIEKRGISSSLGAGGCTKIPVDGLSQGAPFVNDITMNSRSLNHSGLNSFGSIVANFDDESYGTSPSLGTRQRTKNPIGGLSRGPFRWHS